MIVYDTNGEQPLSAMISMITKVSVSCSVSQRMFCSGDRCRFQRSVDFDNFFFFFN